MRYGKTEGLAEERRRNGVIGVEPLFHYVSYINVFLALFNLIPFGPFDGLKIFRWKKEVWGLLIGLDIVLLLILWGLFL